MAAPSYAQAMREANYHPNYHIPTRHYAAPPPSEGEASSIPDIVSVVNFSDTDDNESIASSTRGKRGFGSALKSKVSSRAGRAYGRPPLSPVPSPSIVSVQHGDMDDSESELSRAPSMYSLSRISFSSRLGQLTSIPLPTASSLSAKISSQSTAHLTARCISEAGEQIKIWTTKASDVLSGLDAQDDVEWSSAGGHDGVEEVEQAIGRFEGLVKVYVISIEELQLRSDVRTLSDQTLKTHVDQMEDIVMRWAAIKRTLKGVKEQVEIALEWEELWNIAIGEIAQELTALSELIFEMEEDRHQTVSGASSQSRSIDLDELTVMVEGKTATHRTPIKPNMPESLRFSPGSPIEFSSSPGRQDDSKLLGLFARMQPVRASLDFLPMRLSTFHTKASAMFPTGCIELEGRRDQLESQWKKIETDAEALKKELGEDRWLTVFRNAGNQALKMFDSVERSQSKIKQGILAGHYQTAPTEFARLVESWEAKKTHYVPAIDRVLALIDRGVLDRLSVNGEILRLQSEMKRRHKALQAGIKDIELALSRHNLSGQQLRDSISTIVSERSRTSSTHDTPHSSPASSIVLRTRTESVKTNSTTSTAKYSSSRRSSNIGLPPTKSRLSDVHRVDNSPNRHVSEPYVGKREELLRDFRQPLNKPRWSLAGGHSAQRDLSPSAASETSPYHKANPSPRRYTPSRRSLLPTSINENRAYSPTPSEMDTPRAGRRMHSAQLPRRPASALDQRSVSTGSSLSPYKSRTPSATIGVSKTPATLRSRPSMSTLPTLVDEGDNTTPSKLPRLTGRPSLSRPSSAMSQAMHGSRTSGVGLTSPTAKAYLSPSRRESLSTATPGRRSSLLPILTAGGRSSRAGSRMPSEVPDGEGKAKWRF